MIHVRNFAPHVHGVLLMPKDMKEVIGGVSALSQAGVDDIWVIASDASNTIMSLQAIRTVLRSNHAGVLGFPKDLGISISVSIANKCNFWRFWTQSTVPFMGAQPSKVDTSTLFLGDMNRVVCFGDPLAVNPGTEDQIDPIYSIGQTALCGHITQDVVRTHGHRFGFYVISPFAGRDPGTWHLHADPDLVRAVCREAMVLKEELAEDMDVLR